MPTTNIGPCECCGGAEECPCSTISVCYWVWDGDAWQPQGGSLPEPCDGTDENNKVRSPCCECPGPPLEPGTQIGQTGYRYCQSAANQTSVCSCFHCFATWDAFTQEWVPGSCVGPDGQSGAYTCSCPVAQLGPGDEHGQMVYVICGC